MSVASFIRRLRPSILATVLVCGFTAYGQAIRPYPTSTSTGSGGATFWNAEGGGVIDYLLGDVGIAEGKKLILDNDTGGANTISDDSTKGFLLSSDAFGGSATKAFTLNSTAGTGKNIALFTVSGSTKYTFSGTGGLTLTSLTGTTVSAATVAGSTRVSAGTVGAPSGSPGTHVLEAAGITADGAMSVVGLFSNGTTGFASSPVACSEFAVLTDNDDGGVHTLGGFCGGKENTTEHDTASFAGFYTQASLGTPTLKFWASSAGDVYISEGKKYCMDGATCSNYIYKASGDDVRISSSASVRLSGSSIKVDADTLTVCPNCNNQNVIKGSSTGNPVTINATGGGADVSVSIVTKGAGTFQVNGQPRVGDALTMVTGSKTATVPSGCKVICTDTTNPTLLTGCSVSSTTLTVTAGASDVVNYFCF